MSAGASRSRAAVLVSGGAGYVGSFTVRALHARGERVVVVDDLSKGHPGALPPEVRLERFRIHDTAGVERVLREERFDAIVHFAADCYVGESMRRPLLYWENNVVGTQSLLAAAVAAGVDAFVLSSTCAVYGVPGEDRIVESAPRAPVNPYGRTKVACEQMLEDLAAIQAMRSFRLRYFNAAGGAADGSLGEDHDPETHLVPLALRAAAEGGALHVHGTDYPTPDGTCVRDYVHVDDLARAHVAALDRLREGHPGAALNLGTGRGASVLEVARAAERVTGRRIDLREGPRRPGDPPRLVAAPGSAGEVLDWRPRFARLEDIVASAWEWHRRRPKGFGEGAPPARDPAAGAS